MIDRLETERLILRHFRPSDVAAFVLIYGNPENMRYMGGAKTPAQTQESIQRKIDHWRKHTYGLWCLEAKGTGQVIGHCGLGWLEPLAATEVAYLIDVSHWNRGLATEAVDASVAWGFEWLGLHRIIAITLPEHLASRRVMEKSGLIYTGETLVWDKSFVCYAIERPAYLGASPLCQDE